MDAEDAGNPETPGPDDHVRRARAVGESRLIPGRLLQIEHIQRRSAQLLLQHGDVGQDYAQAMVRADLTSLQAIEGPDVHAQALAAMGRNAAAKSAYREELDRAAPEVARAADLALARQEAGESELAAGMLPQIELLRARRKQMLMQEDMTEEYADVMVVADLASLTAIDGKAVRDDALAMVGRTLQARAPYRAAMERADPALTQQALRAAQSREGLPSNTVAPDPERDQEPNLESVQKARDASRDAEDRDQTFVPPAALLKRFLYASGKYHFRDEDTTVAFTDHGKTLQTELDDPDVARAMVELAQAKGWNRLALRGSDAFRREAWLAASQRGLETTGYSPQDVDRARLREREDARDPRTPKAQTPVARTSDHNREPTPTVPAQEKVVEEGEPPLSRQQSTAIEALKAILAERGDSPAQIAAAVALATEQFRTSRVHVGTLLEHGDAPYEFNPGNASNHYVRLGTPQGEKVIWGADLSRAIEAGDARIGDEVSLAYQGKHPVTVPVKQRDDRGRVVGTKTVTTHRNTWAVNKVADLQKDAADALRAAGRRNRQPVIRAYDARAARPAPIPVQPARPRTQERGR